MRLRNMYIKCKENIDAIARISTKEVSEADRKAYNVTGWSGAIKAIQELEDIRYLQAATQRLLNAVPQIYRYKNEFKVQFGEWNDIKIAKENLVGQMNSVIQIYESMELEIIEENAIDILMPKVTNLTDFSEMIKDLEFIFEKNPVLSDENEKIQFGGLDVGSSWLVLSVVAVATIAEIPRILKNFVAFLDACIVYKSHVLTLQEQKLRIESYEKELKDKEQMIETFDGLFKIYKEGVLDNLCKQTDCKTEDSGQLSRIEHAMDKCIGLMEQGMRFYPAIDSSEEVKLLFDQVKMESISTIKLKEIPILNDSETQ